MIEDRAKWNRRYRRKSYPSEPSRIVKQFYHMAPKGRALDIAAGNCRNSIFLAHKGFAVDAVDISEEGLSLAGGQHLRINRICADLACYELPVARYTLILNINFLERRLFPQIIDALVSGGLLIFETFLKADPPPDSKAFHPGHLLNENELRDAFSTLTVKYYREAETAAAGKPFPRASLIAVKP
jgi:SAM-dependent methyltransferase